MDFLPENIQKYISDISQSESLILKELNRYTNSKVILPRMLSGHVQGRFLSMISKLVNPEIILEVGTYTGYSCLCLAEGLKKNGKIITIEKDEEFASIAKKFFDRSKYREKISLLIKDATKAIENISEKIDLAFIDADKVKAESGFVSDSGSPVKIQVSGSTVTFTVAGVGSSTLTLT